MSQQYNKVLKRKRRERYLKRRAHAAKAKGGAAPTKPATKKETPSQPAEPAQA